MSIVRYTNKKTGTVTLYESTSHYDPETKQSRPIRKYLGRLDPETGKLIESKKRKAKEAVPADTDPDISRLKLSLQEKSRECLEKDQRIAELESENSRLRAAMSKIAAASRSIMDLSIAFKEENA